jgi:hypothetical protein
MGNKCLAGNAVYQFGRDYHTIISNLQSDQIPPGFIEINNFLMKLTYSIFSLIFDRSLANIHSFHPFYNIPFCLSRHDYEKQELGVLISSTIKNQ